MNRIFQCVDCEGEATPCIYIMINDKGGELPPISCPHEGIAKWAERKENDEMQ